jgi:hypothetical protein
MQRNKRVYKSGGFFILPFLIWGYFVISWVVNLVMLLNCDFNEPWKQEIIHGIGLIGPAAGITVWF